MLAARSSKSVSKKLDLGQSLDHQMDHGDVNACFAAGGGAFVIFGSSTGAVPPAKGPFDDPPFRLNFEWAGQTLDDFNRPSPANPNPGGGGLVGRIGPDDPRPFDVAAECFEGQLAAITILHTGRSDDQRPEQSEGVNHHMPLAADDFFFPHRNHVARLARWS
jgi:hypothetical protein